MWVKGKGAAAPLHGQGGCSRGRWWLGDDGRGTRVDGSCKEPRRRPHSGGVREENERWLARRRQPRGLSVAAALAAQGAGSGRARRPEVLETESCGGDGY
ncbi:IMP dehydrogenase [Sesbania bispinosa]|nr:IMP dehydrogenase [Sesbania bispinosa]